jgi:hypothetical protein
MLLISGHSRREGGSQGRAYQAAQRARRLDRRHSDGYFCAREIIYFLG